MHDNNIDIEIPYVNLNNKMRHLVFFHVISENIVSKNISLGIEIYEVFYEKK